jgi:RimJ/RimL family protein N-acetyltransferase
VPHHRDVAGDGGRSCRVVADAIFGRWPDAQPPQRRDDVGTGGMRGERAGIMISGVAPKLSKVDWPVLTERLLLRPAVSSDEDAIWSYRSDAETARWLSSWPVDRATFQPSVDEPDVWAGMVVIELDGAVIGNVLVRIEDPWCQVEVRAEAAGTQAEVGWVLHPDHVGHGYATEAVEAMLQACFQQIGVRRVTAGCLAANTASWKLMERVGMRREQHALRDALHRSGEWMDSFGYALLADEWQARLHAR